MASRLNDVLYCLSIGNCALDSYCLVVTAANRCSEFRMRQCQTANSQCTKQPSLNQLYRVFSHDVTGAILLSQNNETAATFVSRTNHVGVEHFSYANAFFCSNKFA